MVHQCIVYITRQYPAMITKQKHASSKEHSYVHLPSQKCVQYIPIMETFSKSTIAPHFINNLNMQFT